MKETTFAGAGRGALARARRGAGGALLWALCLAGPLACGGEQNVEPVRLGLPPGGEPAALTFWQDVAPVYYKRCVGCHREGGIAPFRLDDYASAKQWASASKDAVQSRRMPPFLATADGSCNQLRDAAWLDDDEMRVVADWADSPMNEGAARADLRPTEPAKLEGEYREVKSPLFTPVADGGPLAENDEYRCFLVDPKVVGTRFLTGYDVVAGNDAIVHHAVLMTVDPSAPGELDDGRTNLELIRAYDDESPDRDGWPCFGAAGDGVSVLSSAVTWAPGQGAVTYPDGIGLRISESDLVVLQIHYNLADPATRGQSAQTSIKLRLAEKAGREGVYLDVDPFLGSIYDDPPASLAPGQAVAPYEWEVDIGGELGGEVPYVELYGVFPHMHERGVSIETSILRADGTEQCVVDVPRWDFGWQLMYFYKTPLRIGPGDRLRTRCVYDTRGMASPLLPGWGSQNEMCLAGLLIAPPQP